eukprot:5711588-Ditylum_brightwellii.AAC.1
MWKYANAPLRVIPKPGQQGKWRILLDICSGGQNIYIAADPVHYPQVPDVLSRLTPGRYSVVIDISKQFYHFPTHPSNRPYLELMHPITKVQLWYLQLPMCSMISPDIVERK